MTHAVYIVAGLLYGDEGKGTIVDSLVRTERAGLVVRYNGGAQAGHNVVTPEGLHHTFAQFGSGTLVPEVRTHLSRFMVINPLSMEREEEHLREIGISDALERTTIEGMALVSTPFEIAANRLLEISRGNSRHGSCGMGIGKTIENYRTHGDLVLFAKDLSDSSTLIRKLTFLQELNRDAVRELFPALPQTERIAAEREWLETPLAIRVLFDFYRAFAKRVRIVKAEYLSALFNECDSVVFEGAQGMLLDRTFGFTPHVTKTDITFANADTLLQEAGFNGLIEKIGVTRAYATRHGAGPLTTRDKQLERTIGELHNTENEWQGKFRVGWLDLPALKYGLLVSPDASSLAITSLDQLSGLDEIRVCMAYEYHGDITVLDPYFEWEKTEKNTARIKAFRKHATPPEPGRIAEILSRCEPLEFAVLPGWDEPITRKERFEDLPQEAKSYISFITGKIGLRIPAHIISVNPTHTGKLKKPY